MQFQPEDVLLKLSKSKLHVIVALAMLPTLRQRSGPYAGKNCLSIQDINMLTDISVRTLNNEIQVLHRWGLITRVHRYGWRLSDGMKQLPIPIFLPHGDRQISDPVVDNLPTGRAPIAQIGDKTAGSEKISDPEIAGSEKISDPDTIMINDHDDDDEVVINRTESVLLLDHIGVGGEDFDRLSVEPIAPLLAAWWYVRSWANKPSGAFVTHITRQLANTKASNGRPYTTPRGYRELARWWLAADEDDRRLLRENCRVDYSQTNLSKAAFKSAKQVYKSDPGFDYPPRR